MGFSSLGDLIDSMNAGQAWPTSFHKTVGSVAYTAGRWYDLTLLAGSPRSNVYPGSMLAATKLWYKSAGSLWHGTPVSPKTKHVAAAQAHTASATVPALLMLCDFLLFYPLLDLDSDAPQEMENVQALTRYTDGLGVKAMLVTTADTGASTSTIYIQYTNHLGVAGRTPPVIIQNAPPATAGQILHAGTAANNYGPFLPLQAGDLGVRQVDNITLSAGVGGGWACVVLVKPICTIPLLTAGVPVERSYITDIPSLPKVHDEAFLGWLLFTGANTGAGSIIRGHVDFIWG